MKKTLLVKAMEIEKTKKRREYKLKKDEVEVVVSFLNGNIGWNALISVVRGIGDEGNINYGRVSKIIKDAVAEGWVRINFVRN